MIVVIDFSETLAIARAFDAQFNALSDEEAAAGIYARGSLTQVLQALIFKIERGINVGMINAQAKVAVIYTRNARQAAPVRTGAMRAGIIAKPGVEPGMSRRSRFFGLGIVSYGLGGVVWYLPPVDTRYGFSVTAQVTIQNELYQIIRQEVQQAVALSVASP